MLTIGILICYTCYFQSGSVYLASSVCSSLQCLISALTQGGEGGLLFRLTCSVVLLGGKSTANKYHWCVWGLLAVSRPHWVCPRSWHVFFQSTLLRLQVALQGVGPGLRALPRSKLFRFRFLGSPERRTLGWACVLCPSQVPAAQATRCLASALSTGAVHLITSPVLAARFLGCSWELRPRCAMCLLWRADLWL